MAQTVTTSHQKGYGRAHVTASDGLAATVEYGYGWDPCKTADMTATQQRLAREVGGDFVPLLRNTSSGWVAIAARRAHDVFEFYTVSPEPRPQGYGSHYQCRVSNGVKL